MELILWFLLVVGMGCGIMAGYWTYQVIVLRRAAEKRSKEWGR